MKLLLTGGGTFGSVTPLLAVNEEVHPSSVFWIGTRHGQERSLIEAEGLPFFPIFSGKFRRYWDWRNLIDPLLILIGFFQSLFLLRKLRPTVILGAGGFVSVPVIVAGWFLRIPSSTIQMDVRPGLTNRLVAPFVKTVFCTFEESTRYFPNRNVVPIGGIVRKRIKDYRLRMKERGEQRFQLESRFPTLLILGGGTGALSLNQMIWEILPELVKICQIIHVTGKEKFRIQNSEFRIPPRYHPFEFLTDDLPFAYASTDLVVTRAGMGTLSELAACAKPSIVVPLPGTHQEENARYLEEKRAAVIFSQRDGSAKLLSVIRGLLTDSDRRTTLGNTLHTVLPTDGASTIAKSLTLNPQS